MFEFEQCEPAAPARMQHPVLEVKAQQEHGPDRIRSYSIMSWGEHCSECAFPTCYQTCNFYQPRQDGRCRRFTFGIYRAEAPRTWMGYSAYLEFKNWSKLWAQGNATQLPDGLNKLLEWSGAAAWALSRPVDLLLQKITGRKKLSLVLQSLRRRIIRKTASLYHQFPKPDCLLIEIYNPMDMPAQVHAGMVGSMGGKQSRFEWRQAAAPGLSSFAIPVSDIERQIDLGHEFTMDLSIAQEEGKRLYFCSATFVCLNAKPVQAAIPAGKPGAPKKIKCLVWDLDHTMWDGILLENGPEALKLKDGIRAVLQELDRRGILLSIASKNSEEDAIKVLETFGIREYFLVPQIGWQPKSSSIQSIAKKLNLGLDSFAFIDDMPFERDEIAASVPGIRVIPAEDYLSLLGWPEFAGDASSDGASRRQMYLTEQKRDEALAVSTDGYDAFLATCEIKVKVQRPGDELVPRIQDIVQRTNQLNISSQRYNEEETRALIHSKENDCFIVSCADKYGDYGYVGFINIARNGGLVIQDCMFSCRIQGKRIDEAVLAHIINNYLRTGTSSVRARFIATKRNGPAGEMLGRLGFVPDIANKEMLVIPNASPREEVAYVQIQGDAA